NPRQVVDRAMHRRADIGKNDRRHVPMEPKHFPKVFVVDLAILLASDHDAARAENAHDLGGGIMRMLRVIDDSVRVEFTREVEPVEIALSSARRHVAPGFSLLCAEMLLEKGDNLTFERKRILPINGFSKRIANIVQREAQERCEFRIIVVLAARVANKRGRKPFHLREKIVEPPSRRCRKRWQRWYNGVARFSIHLRCRI